MNEINPNDGPAALAKFLMAPLTVPTKIFADLTETLARGGQRVLFRPAPSIESRPARFGNRAFMGVTPTFPAHDTTNDFNRAVSPNVARRRPTTYRERQQERRGPRQRIEARTLTKGGEIVGPGREIADGRKVRTSIF